MYPPETPQPAPKEPLVDAFRETAQKTARPNVWQEIYKSLPPTDDPIFTLIETRVRRNKPDATEDELIGITEEYERLWKQADLTLDPQTIDHRILIDFFLEEKLKKPSLIKRVSSQVRQRLPHIPYNPNRRGFLRTAAAVGVGFAAGSVLKSPSPESSTEHLTVFDEFIRPLKEEARRRRVERARSDPNYYHRVDRLLNERQNGDPERINVLLFSAGTMLRPNNDPSIHAANQILSLNTKTRTVDLISITSETRAPNIERYLQKTKGEPSQIHLINGSFDFGQEIGGDKEGFHLMRETFEQATGLSMDFQVVFSDGRIKDFIDQVLEGLEVDLPYDLATYKIDIDGVEYPDQEFRMGKQRLGGVSVVQLMKGETREKWKKGQLPHHRKNIVLDGVTKAIKGNLTNPVLAPIFGTKLAMYLNRQIEESKVKLDFDLNRVLNFGILKPPTMVGRPLGFNELRVGQTVTMMNPDMGGEGVQYVGEDKWTNPTTEKDIAAGVYPNEYEEIPGAKWWSGVVIPYNGNPHAEDLVSDYWGETRRVVRKRLLHAA